VREQKIATNAIERAIFLPKKLPLSLVELGSISFFYSSIFPCSICPCWHNFYKLIVYNLI